MFCFAEVVVVTWPLPIQAPYPEEKQPRCEQEKIISVAKKSTRSVPIGGILNWVSSKEAAPGVRPEAESRALG